MLSLCERLEGEVKGSKRKRRDDGLTSQRWYLDNLIGWLLMYFGAASPGIVANVAAMMGYEIDQSTIERRIGEVTQVKLQERQSADIVSSLAYVPGLTS